MSAIGTWNLTMNSPLGAQTATLKVEDAGGSLTGKGAPSPLEALKVDGDTVAFSADADTPVGKMKLGFTGAVVGDSISGKYSTPFGAFDFTGTRA
jgi:hypothetical protein